VSQQVYAFNGSRTEFIQKIIPCILLFRTNEVVTRLGTRVLRELLEEDDNLMKHRHERMIAAEIRSWANKLKLGSGTKEITGKTLQNTNEGMSPCRNK
jgi:hypothetical protein